MIFMILFVRCIWVFFLKTECTGIGVYIVNAPRRETRGTNFFKIGFLKKYVNISNLKIYLFISWMIIDSKLFPYKFFISRLLSLFYFSTVKHVEISINGLIDSRQFIYYLSFTILILSFTYNVLEYRKWKT